MPFARSFCYPARVPRRPSITIVGAGSFGSALTKLLPPAGYAIQEVVTRAGRRPSRTVAALAAGVRGRAVPLDRAKLDAHLLWLCVPDDALGKCAAEIAKHGTTAKIALHSSGALASDVLAPLQKLGVAVAAAHPLMSFVAGPAPSLKDVLFAVQGDKPATMAASRIARDLGGVPFLIVKKTKALYHAFGAFTSPLLVAHLVTAERLARASGVPANSVRRAMRPIVSRTLDNYFNAGGAKAFSGPLVRGDVETIRKHLQALRSFPAALEVYAGLVQEALASLPVANRARIKRLLNSLK